jgi:hypothetical protein
MHSVVVLLVCGCGGVTSDAGALCNGVNNAGPVIGNAFVHESVRWAATCDNLADYFGKIKDPIENGNCGFIQTTNLAQPGLGFLNDNPRFRACAGWVNYSFTDNNTSSSTKFCDDVRWGADPCSNWVLNTGY